MTLKEAHESGRRYREMDNDPYFRFGEDGYVVRLGMRYVLANYELEPIPEKTTVVSRSQVMEALQDALADNDIVHNIVSDTLDKLGLGE